MNGEGDDIRIEARLRQRRARHFDCNCERQNCAGMGFHNHGIAGGKARE